MTIFRLSLHSFDVDTSRLPAKMKISKNVCQNAPDPKYFCTTFCRKQRLRDLSLSVVPYDHWLSNFQHKNAFHARLLGFVFKLANSLLYVSSIKFTDLPPNPADSHAWDKNCASSTPFESVQSSRCYFLRSSLFRRRYQNYITFGTIWRPK